MSNSWFPVENNLIDRNDLDVYEKMCSVVLARYAGRAEFSNMLNIQVIAIRMGCSVELAERALNGLIEKRLIMLEDTDRIEPEMLAVEAVKVNSRVIRSEEQVDTKPQTAKVFESFDDEDAVQPSTSTGTSPSKVSDEKVGKTTKRKTSRKKKSETSDAPEVIEAQETYQKIEKTEKTDEKSTPRPVVPKQVREGVQDLIDQIFDIVDENINDREARIILSFANNDVELVREKYNIAKRSQVSDKIEMLINELQRKDKPAGKRAHGGEEKEQSPEVNPTPRVLQNSQIDLENINRMVAFKQSSYGKQGNKQK